MRKVKIALDDAAILPVRAYSTDAGMDLFSPIAVKVPQRGSVCIDTGVHIELPKNTAGFLKSKSGLNVKHSITSEGVIDYGYTGSVVVKLYNNSNVDYMVEAGQKITQLVIVKIRTPKIVKVNLENFKESERKENGFGSTGK